MVRFLLFFSARHCTYRRCTDTGRSLCRRIISTPNMIGMTARSRLFFFCILEAGYVKSQEVRHWRHVGWCLSWFNWENYTLVPAVICSIQEHGTSVHLDGKR